MSLHKEISFEAEVCDWLGAHGWLYENGDAAHYDRARALFPPDLVAWVQATQPKAWEALTNSHGASASSILLDRVRKQLDDRGTLDVLRHGVEMIGLKQQLTLAQFRPALAMNADIVARYGANRLRVVRQVRYSTANENCLDLVLFLNGLPVATVELKTDFTQSVRDAVDQYRFDRPPHPKGQNREPLLSFPKRRNRAFRGEQHRSRDDDAPRRRRPRASCRSTKAMTAARATRRTRAATRRAISGRRCGSATAGSKSSAATSSRSGTTTKRQIKALIFPRYHQLDATRRLRAAVLAEGPGQKYLIQHSAGSGKTNSIAWSAHFLADLHDAANEKLFSTVIVVSDRNVIDSQLQEALADFERTKGVVTTIKNEGASKSGQLAAALAEGKKIIVCTIQTFPFALEEVRKLAATQGKRFAVIADEAHSLADRATRRQAQAGAFARGTGGARRRRRGQLRRHSCGANGGAGERQGHHLRRLHRDARRPRRWSFSAAARSPTSPIGPTNLPQPFHVYSMRQAIEEGFILDVLKNYTPYKLAFRLAHNGKEYDEKEVERSAAMKGIMSWVRLHPYNISQKVQIVVEHFRENVAPLLDGKAKAMVVLASRVEAVRWQLAMTKYIQERGYPIGALVAFSGEVNDPESGPDPFNEHSKTLNPNLKGRDIREAFRGADYQLLLVANKFQTGFDEPLLCGMYVDRRLAGIQAVQTLSRLNRAHPGQGHDLHPRLRQQRGRHSRGVPDLLRDGRARRRHRPEHRLQPARQARRDWLLRRLRGRPGGRGRAQSEGQAGRPCRGDRPRRRPAAQAVQGGAGAAGGGAGAERREGRERGQGRAGRAVCCSENDLGAFIRAYTFLSQMFDYGNTAIEKRFIFYRRLLPLLEFGREREGIDLSKVQLTHHSLKGQGKQALKLGEGEAPKLAPLTETGSGSVQDKEKARLAEIIEKVNGLFEGELTDDDQLVYVNDVIKKKMLESEELVSQATNNTKAQFAASPTLSTELMNAIMDALAAHTTMSKQALESERVREGLKDVLLGPAQLYEALRERAEQEPQV